MEKVYSPTNDTELAIIKSILEGEGIDYFVHNDHFGTLKTGPRIDLFNAKTIMVPKDQIGIAKELIDDFLENTRERKPLYENEYSWTDKIRMIIEAVLFTWFIPGKKWKRRKREETE